MEYFENNDQHGGQQHAGLVESSEKGLLVDSQVKMPPGTIMNDYALQQMNYPNPISTGDAYHDFIVRKAQAFEPTITASSALAPTAETD